MCGLFNTSVFDVSLILFPHREVHFYIKSPKTISPKTLDNINSGEKVRAKVLKNAQNFFKN